MTSLFCVIGSVGVFNLLANVATGNEFTHFMTKIWDVAFLINLRNALINA
jgi:hypothetical protein